MKLVIIIATLATYAFSATAWTLPAVSHASIRSKLVRVKETTKKPINGKNGKNYPPSRDSMLLLRAGATIAIDPGFLQSSLKYYVEATGTFILLSSVLMVLKDKSKSVLAPAYIGMVVAAMSLWGGNISGGHFNPAVSFMFCLNKRISLPVMFGYIASQLLGAFLATIFVM